MIRTAIAMVATLGRGIVPDKSLLDIIRTYVDGRNALSNAKWAFSDFGDGTRAVSHIASCTVRFKC